MCAGCRAEFDHPALPEFGTREFDIFKALASLARHVKTLASETARAVAQRPKLSQRR